MPSDLSYYPEIRRSLKEMTCYGNGGSHARMTRSELRATAERIRQVADFFEAHPEQRIKNEWFDGRGVCAIGAVLHARKIGLKWNPNASKNCNNSMTVKVMNHALFVGLNDSTMPAKQFRNYMRNYADLLDRFSDLPVRSNKTWNNVVATNGYFKRWADKVGYRFIAPPVAA